MEKIMIGKLFDSIIMLRFDKTKVAKKIWFKKTNKC